MTTTVRVNESDAVMDALRSTMSSALPALVFTSLAALSVPTFSDGCHVLVDEDGLEPYLIERPLTGSCDTHADYRTGYRIRDSWSGQWVSEHTVQTAFGHTRVGGGIGYRGSVLHSWTTGYRPTGTDVALAQLAVDHAVAILHRKQVRTRAHHRRYTTDAAGGDSTGTDPDRADIDVDWRSLRAEDVLREAIQGSHHAG